MDKFDDESAEAKSRTNPNQQDTKNKTQVLSRGDMMDIRENDISSGENKSADWRAGSDFIDAALDKYGNTSNENMDFNSYQRYKIQQLKRLK